jgi:hypothetical protein
VVGVVFDDHPRPFDEPAEQIQQTSPGDPFTHPCSRDDEPLRVSLTEALDG